MGSRKTLLMTLFTTFCLWLTPFDVEARGGGGGRGGGGRSGGGPRGGTYSGGHTMNRTPTMSRASSRPASSQARQQIQNKSTFAQDNVQRSRQTVQQRPSSANLSELRNQVQQYAQNRPAQNIDRQLSSQNAQNFSNNRTNQITNNRQLSDNLSQRLQKSRPDSNRWFDQNFFDRHHIDNDYGRSGANLWRPAAWATLATWGPWNWSTPYYYDDGGYVYPVSTTDSTYVNPYSLNALSSPMQTQSVQTTQTNSSTSGEWLPLGVFAVTNNINTASQTNRYMQLAINRRGEMAGVLYNSITDAAQDLTGMVDATSQKAYWTLSNRTNSPIASTGIYNLTEDQTPLNVHFSDGSDQTWTLVRVKQNQ